MVGPDAAATDRARDLARGLIERITIHADRRIVVSGDLAAMLRMGAGARAGESDSLIGVVQVVAGARNDLFNPLRERVYKCA